MVGDLDLIRALLEISRNVTEQSLQQFLEWTFRRGDGENSGSKPYDAYYSCYFIFLWVLQCKYPLYMRVTTNSILGDQGVV